MTCRIEFLPSAAKDYRRLEAAIQKRVFRALEAIGDDPLAGKPLHGPFLGRRSYRVGEYRVVYRLLAGKQVALIHAIGHRRDIYH